MLRDPLDLGGLQRTLFAGFGLLWLVLGVTAIYRSEDGAATAVLIVAGALFLAIALFGRMPEELGFGEGFLRLGRTLPELPPDQRGAVMTVAVELAEGLPPRAREKALRAVSSGLEYQRRLIDALHRVLPDETELTAETRVDDRYLDAVLVRGRSSVAVEAKFTGGRPLTATAVAQAAAIAGQTGMPVVLVSDGEPTMASRYLAVPRVAFVRWLSADDDGPLRVVVEAALSGRLGD